MSDALDATLLTGGHHGITTAFFPFPDMRHTLCDQRLAGGSHIMFLHSFAFMTWSAGVQRTGRIHTYSTVE